MWSAFVISLMIGLLVGYLYGTKDAARKIKALENELAQEKEDKSKTKQS